MNGVHDMGGMHGMGAIVYEKDEPVFHEEWEARVFALNRAIGAWRKWNIDAGRHAIELLPPTDYLRMSYYEKWLTRNITLLVEHGLVTREEMESGKAGAGSWTNSPALMAAEVMTMLMRGNSCARPEVKAAPAFQVGEAVRARNIHPAGHTRLPRYVRGRNGVVDRDHGIFVFPDSNAHFLGERPQHLYSVRFAARELWGDEAPARDGIYLDLWEAYLERA
jgi:nitrile hydratase beta subunit